MKMRALLAVMLAVGTLGPAAQAAKKNVVLFVSDDHGLDAGCYGNLVIKTPNLDALAADVLAEMKAKLKAFQKRTKDPWILKWKYE